MSGVIAGAYRHVSPGARSPRAGLEFADVVAPIKRSSVDAAGRIWIVRTGELVTEDGPVDVVGADLRYLGTLPPQKLPDAWGPGGRAAYIVTDDLDVNRIVVRQLPNM